MAAAPCRQRLCSQRRAVRWLSAVRASRAVGVALSARQPAGLGSLGGEHDRQRRHAAAARRQRRSVAAARRQRRHAAAARRQWRSVAAARRQRRHSAAARRQFF